MGSHKLLPICCLIGLSSLIHAQTAWEKPIAPGLVYRQEIDLVTPRIIHALRLTLRSPTVKASPELAQGKVYADDPTKGRATVSQMVKGDDAIGGINGDFFPYTGDPLGLMVRKGELLSNPWPNRSVLAWGPASAACDVATYDATLIAGTSQTKIDGVNRACGINELVLNTEAAGLAITKTPSLTVEILCQAPSLKPTGSLVGTVGAITADAASLTFQPASLLLVANGKRIEDVKNLRTGDTIKLFVRTSGFDWTKVDNAIGGGPRLIRGGEIVSEWQQEKFAPDFSQKRHPRTAIGVTANGDLWMVAIDGRQQTSDGATLSELAAIMKRYRCVEAMNLDGGGSTAINLFNLTLNRPSDGVERPVANGVVLYGPQPRKDPRLLQIQADDKQARVIDEKGAQLPNAQVLWVATGEAWIDQGGNLRWYRSGKATISAFTSGQTLAFEVTHVQPVVPIPAGVGLKGGRTPQEGK